MKRGLFLLLAVSLGLNAGLLYVRYLDGPLRGPGAERPRPPRGAGPPPRPETMARDHLADMTRHLDLSDEQQQEIRVILEERMPLMTELLRASREANQQISDAFAAPEFDGEHFGQLAAQVSRSRAQADSLAMVMLLAEAAVLTPEQRIKYAEVAPTVHSKPQHNPHNKPPRPRRRP